MGSTAVSKPLCSAPSDMSTSPRNPRVSENFFQSAPRLPLPTDAIAPKSRAAGAFFARAPHLMWSKAPRFTAARTNSSSALMWNSTDSLFESMLLIVWPIKRHGRRHRSREDCNNTLREDCPVQQDQARVAGGRRVVRSVIGSTRSTRVSAYHDDSLPVLAAPLCSPSCKAKMIPSCQSCTRLLLNVSLRYLPAGYARV